MKRQARPTVEVGIDTPSFVASKTGVEGHYRNMRLSPCQEVPHRAFIREPRMFVHYANQDRTFVSEMWSRRDSDGSYILVIAREYEKVKKGVRYFSAGVSDNTKAGNPSPPYLPILIHSTRFRVTFRPERS